MKPSKLLFIALALGALAVSSANAQTTVVRTNTAPRVTSTRVSAGSYSTNNWRHHRHYRNHSNVYFGIGLGYPYSAFGYGYGYPYYGSYPYGYGYYARPRTVVYDGYAVNDGSVVIQVQRRLARAGYYHGPIDGVIGDGTRSAIRAYERRHGLPVDGRIDSQFLATLGLA